MPQNTHQTNTEYHANLQKEEEHLAKRLTSARTRGAMSEVGRFSITAIVIFIVAFVGLNFSAYAKRISFLINEPQANELVASLAAVTHKAAPVEAASEMSEPEKLIFHKGPPKIAAQQVSAHAPEMQLAVTPPDSYIFLPRLDIKAPIKEAEGVEYLGDWTYIEKQIQKSLQNGVVHFPGTAQPGQRGNTFITGHSSYYPWDNGRYKDIFALLTKAQLDDDIIVFHGGKKFIYRVSDIREVDPDQTDVLAETDDYRLTLMTCTPLGTALKRLIITAQLVDDHLITQR